MRINVYSQELTDEVVRLEKVSNTGRPYIAAQLILHSSPMLHHPPADDDRSAVTFWLPSSLARRESVATAFERIAEIFRGEGAPAAWRDVQAERRRQVNAKGWTPEHDDEHERGEMAMAAAAYAVSAAGQGHIDRSWPWSSLWSWTGWAREWFKPKNPRQDLVRAGALILAEIERLDRIEVDIQENADYLGDE